MSTLAAVILRNKISRLGGSLDDFSYALPGGSEWCKYLEIGLAFLNDAFLAGGCLSQLCVLRMFPQSS
jgi:hypothetical protein